MSEIIKALQKLDEQERKTNDPAELAKIDAEREHLYAEAYSGAY